MLGEFLIFNFQFSIFKKLAKQHNAVFLKIEPMVEYSGLEQELPKSGFKKSQKEIQPQKTIVLDIDKLEEQLLEGMHKKTRYNIGLAQKKELQFEIREKGGVDLFWDLLQKTTERDRFASHPKEYYKKLLELPFVKLFLVKYEERAVAASIVVLYGNRSYYLHGASDYDHRNLMAPYLLHWEAIKYAKENNFVGYDLWGIDEKKWPGVTRFKQGFGGREVEYVGSYDYIFQPMWYWLYVLRAKLKKK